MHLSNRPLLQIVWLLGTLACTGHADDRLAKDAHADKVQVLKKDRTLILFDHGKVLKKYKVALGADPVGAKTRQGDHKTPEGTYTLDRRVEHSHFYRALHVSYPMPKMRREQRRPAYIPAATS